MPAEPADARPPVTVVLVTRDRVEETLGTLARHAELPEDPPVIVVDNGSSDGTAERVRERFPAVRVIALSENLGAAARNVGVAEARTPYVAFSDDDSWWAPGSLARAVELLEGHPRAALVGARILVGPEQREDPICEEMRDSPLPREPDLPGPSLGGFLACSVMLRRDAYLSVGGFERRLGIGGEEELFCYDLATAGWGIAYVDELTVHHNPSKVRDHQGRRRYGVRNTLWTTWLRRPARSAAWRTLRTAGKVPKDATSLTGFADAVRGLPWVLRARRPVPPVVEHRLRLLDEPQMRSKARTYG